MGKKILIIDDNKEHNTVMSDLLEHSGYKNILVANSGEDGVKKAKNSSPDLVIIDTVLPGIDGIEACKRIREYFRDEKPKIIVMTGFVDAIDAVRAREAGTDDFVVKTTEFGLLLESIKKLI